MLFQSSCRDCDELERQIIMLFTSKYVQRLDYGHEYFEGDQLSMIRDLCDIVRNEGVIQEEGVEETVQDENDENDTSNDVSTVQDSLASNINEDTTESEEEVSVGSNTNDDQDDTANGEEVVPAVLQGLFN